MKVEQERRKCLGTHDEGVRGFQKKLLELIPKWERVGDWEEWGWEIDGKK